MDIFSAMLSPIFSKLIQLNGSIIDNDEFMEFYINKKKSNNVLYIYYGISIVFALVLLFSSGLVTETTSLKGIVISSVALVILAIVLVKANIAQRDTRPMVSLSDEGLTSRTTPMIKAAGLIRWEDITDINIEKLTGDTLVVLSVKNADHYMVALRKKMPAFATKDIVDANGILTLNLSAAELDFDAAELYNHITTYAKQKLVNQTTVV